MKSDTEILSLAHRFRIEVKQVERIKRGVYRLHSTSNQPYCLKRMSYSPARLQWMDRTLLALRSRGFDSIAWRDPQTRAGQTLYLRIKREKSPYILTPWLQGRQPSPESKQDVAQCAKTLAQFHQAGKQIKLDTPGALHLLGTWPQLLGARAETIKRYVSLAKQQKLTPRLGQLLLMHEKRLLQRSENALQLLKNSEYHKLCKKAAVAGALCHGDSGPKNFVLTEKGAAIIDFETLRIDLRIYDIFRLIRLACKNKGWDFSIAKSVLDGYQTVARLEPAEYELLEVWLQFPHKVSKTLSAYHLASSKGKQICEDKIAKSVADEQQLPQFLQELRLYARKD